VRLQGMVEFAGEDWPIAPGETDAAIEAEMEAMKARLRSESGEWGIIND
jgi:hypothetical protein